MGRGVVSEPGRDAQLWAAHDAVWTADSAASFEQALRAFPGVLDTGFREFLVQEMTAPGWDGHARALARSLELASQGDLAGAWRSHREHRHRAEAISERVVELLARRSDAAEVDAGIAAYHEARAIGPGMLVAPIAIWTARGLLGVPGENRQQAVEKAGELLTAALESADPYERAEAAGLRGIAWLERETGDPHENVEHGLDDLTRSEQEFLSAGAEEGTPEQIEALARARTNIAEAFLRRSRGDAVENARRAAAAASAAADSRDPEKTPDEWAYSQIPLARALRRLGTEHLVEPGEGSEALKGVIEHRSRLSEARLAGVSSLLLGEWELASPYRSELERAEAIVARGVEEAYPEDEPELAVAALEHFSLALELTDEPGLAARAWGGISTARLNLGQDQQALEAGRKAVEAAQASGSSAAIISATDAAIPAAYAAGAWDLAATWNDEALAIRLSWRDGRGRRESRVQDLIALNRSPRWAAWAYEQTGDPERAVQILEAGHAHELHRRRTVRRLVSSPDPAWALPADVCEALHAVGAAYLSSPWSDEPSREEESLHSLLAAIEHQFGHRLLSTALPTIDELAGPQGAQPVLYVNPTPWGTQMLLVTRNATGKAMVLSRQLKVTSTELTNALSVGPNGGGGIYLALTSNPDDGYTGATLESAIEEAAVWLGEHFCAPLLELCATANTTEIAAVLCGELTLLPLHVLRLPDGTVLLERLSISYPPSGRPAGLSHASKPRSLEDMAFVALAEPGDSPHYLQYVEAEIDACAGSVPWGRTIALKSPAATELNLFQQSPGADVLHLACHGRGGLLLDGAPALELSDRDLPSERLATLDLSRASLVVLSACESAVLTRSQPSAEHHSLATAALMAGGDQVVATAWPVDDWCCGTLLARFYAELSNTQASPRDALRAAQLWMMNAGATAIDDFLAGYPALRSAFRTASRRTDSDSYEPRDEAYWQELWAWGPFMLVGR